MYIFKDMKIELQNLQHSKLRGITCLCFSFTFYWREAIKKKHRAWSMDDGLESSSSVYLYEDKDLNGTLSSEGLSPKMICHTDLVFMPMEVSKKAKARIRSIGTILRREYHYEYECGDRKCKVFRAVKKGRSCEIFTSFGAEETRIGSLKGSICGNRFVLYIRDTEILNIDYECQTWRKKGPRVFNVVRTEPMFLSKGSLNRNIANKTVFCNRKPFYNRDTNEYMLNFNGRVTLPSSRNFQLVNPMEPSYTVLIFGKINESVYALDHTYPWNAYQAFGIGLASLIY